MRKSEEMQIKAHAALQDFVGLSPDQLFSRRDYVVAAARVAEGSGERFATLFSRLQEAAEDRPNKFAKALSVLLKELGAVAEAHENGTPIAKKSPQPSSAPSS